MKKMTLFVQFVVLCLFCGCSSENPMEFPGVGTHFDGTVDGVSQKGPFLTGSTVTLQELDAKSLEQTGKSFKGKITNDKGEFAVDNVNLDSPYGLLVANGYFRNEVTGKKSSGTITLMAFADLSNRSHVNVNLLTHLEYGRVRVLLDQKKMSFVKAKNKADQEIFSNFFDMSISEKAENLSIFEDSEGGRALLAINVLLLGNLSESEFMERLIALGDDFARDGVWNDALLKTKIADYACGLSVWGELLEIRKNMEAWKIADVPAFEPYVNRFWADQYGLGTCDASNVGERKKNANETSVFYGMNFICDKDSGWVANKNELSVMWDPRDGHIYKYMNIGGTDWMTSNLRYDNGDFECFLGNCEDYGYLYKDPGVWRTFFESNYSNPAGICPSGWRIPVFEDYEHLEKNASENDIKQLFSEAERNIILASGVDSTSYWLGDVSVSQRYGERRRALDVYRSGRFYVDVKKRGDAVFVRCVRD